MPQWPKYNIFEECETQREAVVNWIILNVKLLHCSKRKKIIFQVLPLAFLRPLLHSELPDR